MADPLELDGKLIAIIGAAATGLAAAPVLAARGARVRIYDSRPADDLRDASTRLAHCADLVFGDGSYAGIQECDLIVPSPGVPREAAVLQEAVQRGTPVLSEIEIAYRISRAPIVAVTGTNGKTTTVFMIAEVLRAAGREVQVAGNTLAAGVQVPLIQAAAILPETAWIVSEVSSFQLEWVERFRPHVAVITNITEDHMNRHHTMAAYIAAKANLLRAQTAEDWSVLNLENGPTRDLMGTGAGRLLRFGRPSHSEEGACCEGVGVDRRVRGRLGPNAWELMPVSGLRVPGEHTIENALAASCAGLAVGAAPDSIRRALEGFRGVPDRLEHVQTVAGVDWINNTMCTNVDAAVRSIEAYDRPMVLIAGGKDKGSDFEPLGRAIAGRVKVLIAIGADGPLIAAAARRYGFGRIREAGSMRDAVRQAAAAAVAGDVVMLAPGCASFDWYRSFEARGADFKQEVARLAADMGAPGGA